MSHNIPHLQSVRPHNNQHTDQGTQFLHLQLLPLLECDQPLTLRHSIFNNHISFIFNLHLLLHLNSASLSQTLRSLHQNHNILITVMLNLVTQNECTMFPQMIPVNPVLSLIQELHTKPPLFTTSIPPPLYYSPPLQQTRIVERRGLWEHTEDEEEEEEYEEEEKDDSAEEEEDSYEGTRGYSVEEDPTASRGGYLPPDLWELLQSFQPEKQPTLKEMRDRTRSSMQEDGEWIGFPYEKIEINEPPSDISPILLDA